MQTSFFQRITAAFRRERPLHPIDHQLAKKWIKQRLVIVFPQLRNNPQALELAYQNLGMEVQPGHDEGDAEAVFVLNAPEAQ